MGVRVFNTNWNHKDNNHTETLHDYPEATLWNVVEYKNTEYLEVVVEDEDGEGDDRIVALFADFSRVESYDVEEEDEG